MSTKKKLYIVVLIWAAVALQIFITKRIDRESQMVTQVMSDGVENVTAAEVKLYAHYGDETMTEAAREKILQRVGEKLGIISGYDIITSTEGENTSTTFVKKGENGDTTIRLISMEQTNADGSTIQENYLMTCLLYTSYVNFLAADGGLTFKTDNRPLFDFSLEQVELAGWEMVNYTFDLHHSEYAEGNVMTEYEEKFSAMGNPICRMVIKPPKKK